ncbi:MAG: hypothetical protein ACI9DJ_003512 [Algoriphagus sp.]|jgi:hypothetical protein
MPDRTVGVMLIKDPMSTHAIYLVSSVSLPQNGCSGY